MQSKHMQHAGVQTQSSIIWAAPQAQLEPDLQKLNFAGSAQQAEQHVSAAKAAATSGQQADVSEQATLGFIFNAASTVFVMIMGVCARLAGEHGIPVMEIVLARSSTVLVFALATILYRRQDPRGNRRWLLLGRGLVGFCGISLWYSALLLLPLSDVVVFGFLTPLLVALLSPLLIKELPSKMVLAMTPVCIAGVVMVTQPPLLFGGTQRLNSLGVGVAVLQAFVSCLVKLSVRELRTTDSSNVIIFWLGGVSTIGSLLACIVVPGQWVLPRTFPQIAFLAGTGLSAYIFQCCMTMGLRRVRAAPAAAIAYLSVVWGILAGIFIFREVPTLLSIAGAVIICLGTLAVVVSETSESSRHQTSGFEKVATHDDEENTTGKTVELAAGLPADAKQLARAGLGASEQIGVAWPVQITAGGGR